MKKTIDKELAEIRAMLNERRDDLVGVALVCERILNINNVKVIHEFCRQALNTLDDYRPKGKPQ